MRRVFITILAFVLALYRGALAAATKAQDISVAGSNPPIDACNGYVGYCNRTINQVLWIGAHNALTDVGFALQRNQYVSGVDLLEAGIRYFDVDTCAFTRDGKRTVPMVCHGQEWYIAQVYQPTIAALAPIKAWLDAHPREVVVLNFGDISDFTALDSQGLATSTLRLRLELVQVVRGVFGSMAVLRGDDPWDAAINANKATLNALITANRRVVVNIGNDHSDNAAYWGMDDRVCRHAWYQDSLHLTADRLSYDWTPVLREIEQEQRQPCASHPLLFNKLEFAFVNDLSGIVDGASVGSTLAAYMQRLVERNRGVAAPFFPFNLVLTDHSDKWTALHRSWHHLQLDNLAAA
ncbi:unnamed protein product [Aphanomyces euteiches]